MQRKEVCMDSPAAVHPPDLAQIKDGATPPGGFLNAFGFHVVVILLGIALAFM
jgi:hypothetical protein